MKKIILGLILLVGLWACQTNLWAAQTNEMETITAKCKKFFEAGVDRMKTVDSFNLIKIDTVNELNYVLLKYKIYIKRLYKKMDSIVAIAEKQKERLGYASEELLKELPSKQSIIDNIKRKSFEELSKADTTKKAYCYICVFETQLRDKKDGSVKRKDYQIVLNANKDVERWETFFKQDADWTK